MLFDDRGMVCGVMTKGGCVLCDDRGMVCVV